MAKKLLTKKYQQSDKTVFRGKILHYNAAVSDRYRIALMRLVKQMTSQSKREIMRTMNSDAAAGHFAMDADIASQARITINALKNKFESLFGRKAKELANQMMNWTMAASKSAIHSSMEELSGGLSLKTDILTGKMQPIVKARILENVTLIKSIPDKYYDDLSGDVYRAISSGGGYADILAHVEERLDDSETKTLNRAKNIALDQTRKAFSQINKARMQDIGLEEFEWIHSGGGQHPREQHMEWDGQIFRFDSPPVSDATGTPVMPAEEINCKCTFRPVLRLKEPKEGEPDAAE